MHRTICSGGGSQSGSAFGTLEGTLHTPQHDQGDQKPAQLQQADVWSPWHARRIGVTCTRAPGSGGLHQSFPWMEIFFLCYACLLPGMCSGSPQWDSFKRQCKERRIHRSLPPPHHAVKNARHLVEVRGHALFASQVIQVVSVAHQAPVFKAAVRCHWHAIITSTGR